MAGLGFKPGLMPKSSVSVLLQFHLYWPQILYLDLDLEIAILDTVAELLM